MLIEFVGCSGAGKTTLAKYVVEALRQEGARVAYSAEMVAKAAKVAWIPNERWQNVALNFFLLPWYGRSYVTHRSFYRFVSSIIRRDASSIFDRMNRSRSFMRQMSTYEVLRRREAQYDVIVVDECTLGSAHNLFAHVARAPQLEELREFSGLVPLPEVVVHVETNLELALQRTLARPDPPIRRAREGDRIEKFLVHGQQVYQCLTRCPDLSSRVLTISNNQPLELVAQRARQLAELVMQNKENDEHRSTQQR